MLFSALAKNVVGVFKRYFLVTYLLLSHRILGVVQVSNCPILWPIFDQNSSIDTDKHFFCESALTEVNSLSRVFYGCSVEPILLLYYSERGIGRVVDYFEIVLSGFEARCDNELLVSQRDQVLGLL